MTARKARDVSDTNQGSLDWIAPDLRSLARPVSSLALDAKNARRHSDANLAGIKASLRAHGQRKPIVVREGVVIAGNGTLEAARTLGWTHLAAVEYEGPEALARAYAIADNRAAELATWDDEALAAALQDADAAGLLEATAFERDAADAILSEDPIMVEEIPVSDLFDRFTCVVTGPMPVQPDVLRALKATLASVPGVSVQIKTSDHGD